MMYQKDLPLSWPQAPRLACPRKAGASSLYQEEFMLGRKRAKPRIVDEYYKNFKE
jgi:hypothetical protein